MKEYLKVLQWGTGNRLLSPLTVYPVLLLVFTFYGARLTKRGQTAREYLNLEQTRSIQAAACIGIILHHVTQQVTAYGALDRGPITVFNDLGFLFTGVFFFFSGYGLLTSYRTKPDYLKNFPGKRLPAVLIPFWTINLLIVLLNRFVYGINKSLAADLKEIFGITLVNSNGWFVIEIVILYLIFYVLFSRIRNPDAALVLLCIAVLVLILYGFFREHDPMYNKAHWFRGEWWYNSTISFSFGLCYARFRNKTDVFCAEHYPFLVAITTVLLIGTISASSCVVRHYGYYHGSSSLGRRDAAVTLAVQMAACLVFLLFLLLVNMRITIGNRALRFVGGMRLPLFLVHGYFLSKVFSNIRMSEFSKYAAVIVSSIAFCAVLTPALGFLVGKAAHFLTRKRRISDTLEARNAQARWEKRKRIFFIAAAALCLLTVLYLMVGQVFLAGREYQSEREEIRQAGVGSRVHWGRYDMEPGRPGRERLTWLVIGKEEDRVHLLCERGIAGSWYHQKHQEVSWEECDLRNLLNSEAFTGMFSWQEAEDVIPEDGDLVTLLTVEEARKAFETDKDRELSITAVAEANGTNVNRMSKANLWDMKGYRSSWWWLRGNNGEKEITAPIVTVDGEIRETEKAVNKPGGAIRPVIWVKAGKEENNIVQ